MFIFIKFFRGIIISLQLVSSLRCGNFKATTFIKDKNRERSKILNKACNTCVAFTFNDQQKHTEIQSLRWTMNIV